MEYGAVRKICGDGISDPNTIKDLEASNLPAQLIGGVEQWRAISRWDPARGGLHHLKSLAGSTVVQAITSNSGSAFYGHIRGHDRVAVSFGGFIDRIISEGKAVNSYGSPPRPPVDGNDSGIPSRGSGVDEVDPNIENKRGEGERAAEECGEFDGQLYLAQVSIFSKEAGQETALSPLMQDIEMPLLLKSKEVSDINLWMSMSDSRSSTHYDPYHNLLCVVAGEKKVTLWSPSAAPFLYPLPINGEASNHSGVDFAQPDYEAHPLFHKALSVAHFGTLRPGDALFIPEGWYHQVDSCGVTIAVNFWWPSKVSLALGTHMDAYFLRRVLANLVDQEKDRMLGEDMTRKRKPQQQLLRITDGDSSGPTSGPTPGSKQDIDEEISLHSVEEFHDRNSNNGNNKELANNLVAARSGSKKSPKQVIKVEDLTSLERYNLNCLVESLTTKSAGTPDIFSKASAHFNAPDCRDVNRDDLDETSWEGISGHSQTDPIARVFSTSTALSLQRLLLVMAIHFPRMLETLMLTGLTPSAAEILTRKFEELDASTDQSSQAAFYEQFYMAFESPDTVMEALLNGKEAFAALALQNILTEYLGIDCSHGSSSS